MDTLKTLTYDVTGRIARITPNRPERGNGTTFEMRPELAACVEMPGAIVLNQLVLFGLSGWAVFLLFGST